MSWVQPWQRRIRCSPWAIKPWCSWQVSTGMHSAPVIWVYGDLRAELERQGTPIGALDTMIAAHALSQQCTLVTNNTREFARVPGLAIENWVQPS
jgi:hypothetical protein